ncbi:MAG: hypothetical protein H0T54_08570 [Geodermatophilaceae bacterium]|nr:hypothetical protein [Geodermatophilaceae bacterium]
MGSVSLVEAACRAGVLFRLTRAGQAPGEAEAARRARAWDLDPEVDQGLA